MLLFFLLGRKKRESDLTAAELRLITEQRDLFLGSLATIIDRVGRGVDTTGTIERLISQAASLFWIGFVHSMEDTKRYVWHIDPEKDSCVTCLSLDGEIKTGAEWKELARTEGIYPRSVNLACTGRWCGCNFEPA